MTKFPVGCYKLKSENNSYLGPLLWITYILVFAFVFEVL